MKFTALFALIGTFAYASIINFEGRFVEPITVTALYYSSEASCVADKGRWEDEMCVFDSENEVIITRNGNKLLASVSTVNTNMHLCNFDGEVVKTESLKAVAQAEVEEWNNEKQEFEKAICELTISYGADGNSVSVIDNGKCQSLCGHNAYLEINKAERVN